MWSNFHSHSHYCDGKGLLQDYVTEARALGMLSLGFSSHAPIPGVACRWCMKEERFTGYLDDITQLKAGNPDLQLYKGLEIDFIPGIISTNTYQDFLDYTVGSIHFVDADNDIPWEIDGSHEMFLTGLKKIFANDVRAAISRYYELTRQMVLQSPPDIVGHLDKIKIQNQPGSEFQETETWYQDEIEHTLSVIQTAGVIVEVNTRGLYQKKSTTPYPSPWILKRIHDLAIPVTLSSDAHNKNDLVNGFKSMSSLLTDIGFKNISILKDGIWKPMPFNEHGIIV